MATEFVSVEEHLRTCPIDDSIQQLLRINQQGDPTDYKNLENNCNLEELIQSIGRTCNKNEFNQYLPETLQSTDVGNNYIKEQVLDNAAIFWTEQLTVPCGQTISQSDALLLSDSVKTRIVKQTKKPSCVLELPCELEETYKPRYKTDYLSNSGTARCVRYVANIYGHHFIPLKVTPRIEGFIRIDRVTCEIDAGVRYSMPYKIQNENKPSALQYSNPVYKPIKTDDEGIVRLQIILIKSKQDELKSAQPLQRFPPIEQTLNTPQPQIMPPKDLIRYYQLDKSQLAFSFSTLNPDGISYSTDWSTTVYSTIMTEEQTSNSKKRTACCPNCSYEFELSMESTDDTGHEKTVKKRKK